MKKIVLVLSLLLFACQNLHSSLPVQRITTAELDTLLNTTPPLVKLVDLRPNQEYMQGHITGSISLPYDTGHFDAMYQRLEWQTHNQIVFVDTYEHRALDAAQKMLNAGFTQVYILDGGFTLWESQGYAIEKEQQ